MLNTSDFFLNLMHKVKTQRSRELFVRNILFFYFIYVVIIKNYKVKKLFNKFPEISGKIGINFQTHNPICKLFLTTWGRCMVYYYYSLHGRCGRCVVYIDCHWKFHRPTDPPAVPPAVPTHRPSTNAPPAVPPATPTQSRQLLPQWSHLWLRNVTQH